MVNQQLRIDTEQLIEQILIMIFMDTAQRTQGHIPHGKEAMLLQFFRITSAHPPKIRNRPVGPKFFPIAYFVQFRNAYAVLIRRHMFGFNIHGNFRQIEIRADSRRCRYARFLQHIANHLHSQLMGCNFTHSQIGRHINKHLINAVHMNVLR